VEIRSEIVERKNALLSLETREICENCNNGWMSDIEGASKPIVIQLARSAIASIAIGMNRDTTRQLAVWAQKTALTYELSSGIPRVGNVAMFERLRDGRRLPGQRHPIGECCWWPSSTTTDPAGVLLGVQIGLHSVHGSGRPVSPSGDRLAILGE
jgi:hypothetical protein